MKEEEECYSGGWILIVVDYLAGLNETIRFVMVIPYEYGMV